LRPEEFELSDFEELALLTEQTCLYTTNGGKTQKINVEVKTRRNLIQRKYQQLCAELKLLYVAITRTKNTLFIFDDDNSGIRKPLQSYWKKLGFVEVVTKDMLANLDTLP